MDIYFGSCTNNVRVTIIIFRRFLPMLGCSLTGMARKIGKTKVGFSEVPTRCRGKSQGEERSNYQQNGA
jgi:hypothetical protein